jgi:hypothetical protein
MVESEARAGSSAAAWRMTTSVLRAEARRLMIMGIFRRLDFGGGLRSGWGSVQSHRANREGGESGTKCLRSHVGESPYSISIDGPHGASAEPAAHIQHSRKPALRNSVYRVCAGSNRVRIKEVPATSGNRMMPPAAP